MLILFAAVIFVSAALLFLVQPMFASMVLPLLGGSPSVWNTTAMFFQVALLAGYGYTHFARTRLSLRKQAVVHAVLVLVPLLVMPIGLREGWQPAGDADPIPWLLLTLVTVAGLPYFAVATTSPLMQAWFSHTGHPAAKDPYFLYAASNIGSLLGLLIYPFALQPILGLHEISQIWALVYGLFIVLMLSCVAVVFGLKPALPGPLSAALEGMNAPAERISAGRRIRWVLLAAVPSSLMLSVTTYLSTDIAAIPMLWVLPLALYLITFIFAFSRRQFVSFNTLSMLAKAALAPMALLVVSGAREPLPALLVVHLLVFFIVALACHTAFANDRPSAARLTEFYLWMSLGGALGGVFNAVIAPMVFNRVIEYPLVLALALILLWQPRPGHRPSVKDFALPALVVLPAAALMLVAPALPDNLRSIVSLAGLVAGVLGAVVFIPRTFRYGVALGGVLLAGVLLYGDHTGSLVSLRSFFGVTRVTEEGGFRKMVHGTTLHGMQSLDPARQCEPLSYYTASGPAGQVVAVMQAGGAQRNVAMVGLGVGSLAGFARPDESWTFYEIDPLVEQVARDSRYFSYLSTCAPQTKVVLGDGRLSLANVPDGKYDLIVLDAYSSDALPVHLLTREAMALYGSKLKPDGLLLFHISNRYFDLRKVLGNLAEDQGLAGLTRFDLDVSAAEAQQGKWTSTWTVIARNASALKPFANDTRWEPLQTHPDVPLWTDSYSSLLTVLK
jgi:hypothetical protein